MLLIPDTHALIWLFSGDKRLSRKAKAVLTDASQQFIIPAIVLAEVEHTYLLQYAVKLQEPPVAAACSRRFLRWYIHLYE